MYTFEEIKGHELIIKSLQNSIKYNKVSYCYIFDGPIGMGKKLLAKTFAKTLQCEEKGITPCNDCVSCKSFDTLNQPDIIYIEPKKSTIGVEEIREKINRNIEIKPYKYEYKIIIIDNACTMTHSAQNAILKTIENPPIYGIFLFISTNINNFLPTIISRSISFKLKPVSNENIRDYINENTSVPDNLLDFYIVCGQGNIGYVNKLINDESFFNTRDTIINIITDLDNKDLEGVFSQFKILEQYKSNLDDVIDIMCLFLRDAIIAKEVGINNVLQRDKIDTIQKYIENLTLKSLLNKLDAVFEAKESLKQNGNFQMTIEVMMLKLRQS